MGERMNKRDSFYILQVSDFHIRENVTNDAESALMAVSDKLKKRAAISDNTVVGASSVVTKNIADENCVLAGNPSRTVKRNIIWNRKSPMEYD